MLHVSLYEDVLETNFSWKESLDAVILPFFFFFSPNLRHDAMMPTDKLHRFIRCNFQDKIAKVANWIASSEVVVCTQSYYRY